MSQPRIRSSINQQNCVEAALKSSDQLIPYVFTSLFTGLFNIPVYKPFLSPQKNMILVVFSPENQLFSMILKVFSLLLGPTARKMIVIPGQLQLMRPLMAL